MRSIVVLGALVVLAAPLAAQKKFRTGDVINPAGRAPIGTSGTVLGGRVVDTAQNRRKSDHIPPGQMPPAGMCRIWIDGVPPGQQPAPTDCQTAVATKPANARVIFGGDGSSFPGKGKGKFKQGKDKSGIGNGERGTGKRSVDRDGDDDGDELDRDRGEKPARGKSLAKRGKKG